MKPNYSKAADHGLAACYTCGKVSELKSHPNCPRCKSQLYLRKPHSIQKTLALTIAAAILYIPSQLLPILTVTEFGAVTHNTIMGGFISFWKLEAYPIAIVIFCASFLIPVLKIGSLVWLCLAATGKSKPSADTLGRVFWLTELLGRWSMIDIFVVGILVSLVQLGNYMTIIPGPGALAFAAVVMLTMFAAMNFDPRLLWDRLDHLETDEPSEQPPNDSSNSL